MMKNPSTRLFKKVVAVFPIGALLLAFLLLNSVTARAQNYVSPAAAEVILKPEINNLYANLTSLTPGTLAYNQQYATMNYYTTIVSELNQGKTVAVAIETARPGTCYPTPTTDCTPLDNAQALTIVESTKVLLSN